MNGLPSGAMLIGPAFTDERPARVAGSPVSETRLAVVGAHPTGRPLNARLPALGARLERTTATAPVHRLHALRTSLPKPGPEHVGATGSAIEVRRLPAEGSGRLPAALPRPMTPGSVEPADGTAVPGFLCEPGALTDAGDITRYGGRRSYVSEG